MFSKALLYIKKLEKIQHRRPDPYVSPIKISVTIWLQRSGYYPE